MVEDVEELRPKLQVQPLEEPSVLRYGKIRAPEMWSVNRVASQVPEAALRVGRGRVEWLRKGVAVKITNHVRRRLPIGIDRVHPRYQIRPLVKIRRAGKLVERRAACIVGAYDGHRAAALRCHNSVEQPAFPEFSRPGEGRKLVSESGRKAVARIEIRRPAVRCQIETN